MKTNDSREDDLKQEIQILINNNCKKVGNLLVTEKINLRKLKIIGTIVENYINSFYIIRIDEAKNNFIKKELFVKQNILFW